MVILRAGNNSSIKKSNCIIKRMCEHLLPSISSCLAYSLIITLNDILGVVKLIKAVCLPVAVDYLAEP